MNRSRAHSLPSAIRRAAVLPLVAVIAGCAPGASGSVEGVPRATPPAAWTARVDLDGDGVAEDVSAWFDAGRDAEARGRGVLVVGRDGRRWTSPLYPMWKARAGDLDGDGRHEVVLGVWSWRRRHDEPQPHRTVWVLGWEDGPPVDRPVGRLAGRLVGRLVERWRGSALARPLVDFELEAPPQEAEGAPALLVARERTGPTACHRTRYRWNGFGFEGVDHAPEPCESPDRSRIEEEP